MVACVVIAGRPAQAAPDEAEALQFVETLYRTVQTLSNQSARLGDSAVAPVFLTADLAKSVRDVAPFDPFIGADGTSVERYQLRSGGAAADSTVVEAAVLAGGTPRLIRLTLIDGPSGPLVADIAGTDWTLAEKLAAPDASSDSLFATLGEGSAASPPAPGTAATPQQSEEPPVDIAALIAADDATSGVGATEPGLPLPFIEEFDGVALGDGWQVVNPDEDAFVVDGGEIYVVTSGADDRVGEPEADNLFTLNSMPAGDFDAVLDAKLEARSGEDAVTLALWGSPSNHIALRAYVHTKGCGPALYLSLTNLRPLGAEGDTVVTSFTRNLFDKLWVRSVCSSSRTGRARGDLVLERLATDGFRLVLTRRGHLYTGRIEMNLPATEGAEGGPTVYQTRDVARFDLPGPAALLVGQNRNAGRGEGIGQLDRFALVPAGDA